MSTPHTTEITIEDGPLSSNNETTPKRSIWGYLRSPRFIKAMLLGQLLALCITGSNTSTTKLAQVYNINAPTMQSCLNYILLALVYNGWILGKHGIRHWFHILRDHGWKYLILGIVDVEANYFVVKAYQYTSLTSAMLLDSWAIPCCMILSYFLLKRRYRWLQYFGVFLCLAGAALLFKSDLEADHDYPAQDALRGDLFCILGATLYGVSNVLEEKLATTYDITEIIGMLGLVGALVSGIQLSILEREELASMTWSGPVIGYLIMFDICLFCLYSCAPLLFRLSSATFFNMSLLTSDFYSLIVGLFIFNAKINVWYAGAFLATVAGIIVYNLRNPEDEHTAAHETKEKSDNGSSDSSNNQNGSNVIESATSNTRLINRPHDGDNQHATVQSQPQSDYISLAVHEKEE